MQFIAGPGKAPAIRHQDNQPTMPWSRMERLPVYK